MNTKKTINGSDKMVNYLAIHETLDIHELLTTKNLALTKTATMSKLVQDPELKTIMEADVTTATKHIEQLVHLLTQREE
jgi:similar to spore coat protein